MAPRLALVLGAGALTIACGSSSSNPTSAAATAGEQEVCSVDPSQAGMNPPPACKAGLVCIYQPDAACASAGQAGSSGPPTTCYSPVATKLGEECSEPKVSVCGPALTCKDLGTNQLAGCTIRVCVETDFCESDADCSPTQTCKPFPSGFIHDPAIKSKGVCATK